MYVSGDNKTFYLPFKSFASNFLSALQSIKITGCQHHSIDFHTTLHSPKK